MLKIGITGGIGCGKSMVSKMFSILDIPVFDADKEAKIIMARNEKVKQALIQEFGKETYLNDELNRKYLASIVFSNEFYLHKLNSIVHPAVIKVAENWFKLFKAPYVIKEAALMFESGSVASLDYVIGVSAPKHIRIKRTMERDNISRNEVLMRMDHQLDEEIKMKLCDFIIVNDEQQSVIRQVLCLHNKLLKLSGEKIPQPV